MVESNETGFELIEFLKSNNFVRTSNLIATLLDTPAMNRLKGISYLGSLRFTSPDRMDFSRWDHSIGTAYLIAKVLIANEFSEEDAIDIIVSGLLHDVGNVFFSHIGEAVLKRTRNLDQGKLFRHVVGSEGIRNVLQKYGVHDGNVLTAYQRRGLLLDSHFDCDTLDGISRTAEVLGLKSIDWADTLHDMLHFDDGEFHWNKESIELLKRHWKLKGRIYSDFVDSKENQACEAMLEQVIELLDIQSIWISDDELIEAAIKNERTSKIMKKLQKGEFYEVIDLNSTRPPLVDRWSQNEEDRVWLELVIKELQEQYGRILESDESYFRIKVNKAFAPLNFGGEKDRKTIPWSEIQDAANKSYDVIRCCQLCLPRTHLDEKSRDVLYNYEPKLSTFHGTPLATNEAETLYRWERDYNWTLRKIPYDTADSGVDIIDGHVIQIHIDASRISSRSKKQEFDLDDIRSFQRLQTVRFSTKKYIPESVGSLEHLEKLYLKIDTREGAEYSFPSSIFNLPKLQALEIYFWGTGSIPIQIENLKNLESLKLRAFNRLEIPSSIGGLSNLKYLNIEISEGSFLSDSIELAEIPDSIGELEGLEHLELKIYHLDSLPKSVGQISSLITMRINRTKLQTIPDSLSNLINLEELDLRRNQLVSLPDIFSRMEKLRTLDVQENGLESLPDSISKTHLKKVNISKNKFSVLPDSLSSLRLQELRCQSNPIQYFPDWCICIQKLSFSDDVPLRFPYKTSWCSETIQSLSHSSFRAFVLPPMLLKNHDGAERRFFERIFYRSTEILTNLEDYVTAFLEDPPCFRPFLLKFNSRVLSALENRSDCYKESSWQKELLSGLILQIRETERKRHAPILFVSIFEDEGSRTYPLGVLTLATLLKEKWFSSIMYLEYLIQYCDASDPSTAFDRFSGLSRPDPWKTQYSIYDNFSEYEPFFSEIKEAPLVLIGPVFTCYLQELMFLVRKIRTIRSDAIILAGGPHFGKSTEMDDDLLKMCPELDGIVIGEAEQTILDFAEIRLHNDTREAFLRELSSTPLNGIKISGVEFTPQKQVEDLDQLPLPDLDLLESITLSETKNKPPHHTHYTLSDRRNPYLTTIHGVFVGEGDWGATADDAYLFVDKYRSWGSREVEGYSYSPRFSFGVISGSRGCPFKCAFCASHDNRRVRSATHVFREMLSIHEQYGVNLFVFFDPLFTTTKPDEQRRVVDLSDLLITSRLNEKVVFEIEIRADVILNLPLELLQKLIHSGCGVMNLGLEKGSDEALARIDKHMKIEQHHKAIAKIRRASRIVGKDVLINGTFIIGGHEETRSDIRDTMIHAFNLDLDGLAIFPLEIHPDTKDYERALELGVIETGIAPYLKLKRYPLFYSTDVSKQLLLKLNDGFTQVMDGMRELREEVNRLGTESSSILPRISEITGINNATRDDMLVIADRYARWFQKKVRKAVADLWRKDVTSFELPELNDLLDEINLLETELENIREKPYERHPSDYDMGNLRRAVAHFLTTFSDFINGFEITM